MTSQQSSYDIIEIRGHEIALRRTRKPLEIDQLPPAPRRREVPCPFCSRTARITRVTPNDLAYECYCGPTVFTSKWSEERDFVCDNCGGLYADHEAVSSKRLGCVLVCPDAFEAALFRFTTPVQELRDGVPYSERA